jgi:hypothetical protein
MMLRYTRLSLKFVAKFFLTLVISMIPLLLFLNPLWSDMISHKIKGAKGQATTALVLQSLGLFWVPIFLILLFPMVGDKFDMETYKTPTSYEAFKKCETSGGGEVEITPIKKAKENEMVPRKILDLAQSLEL